MPHSSGHYMEAGLTGEDTRGRSEKFRNQGNLPAKIRELSGVYMLRHLFRLKPV